MHDIVQTAHVNNLTEEEVRTHLNNILKLICIDDYSDEVMYTILTYAHSEKLALIDVFR